MALLTKMKYSFISRGMDEETFTVVSFKGFEAISKPYEFEILLVSDKTDIDPLDVLKNPVVFTIHRDREDNVDFNGILISFEETMEFDGYLFFKAVLAPKLWWLTLTHHNQVFLGMTIPQIMESALKDGGLFSGKDFDFPLNPENTYSELEYVCQYDESHLNFVSRWAEREGIYYYFEQTPSGEKVIFTDTKIRHIDLTLGKDLVYEPPSGLAAAHTKEVIHSFVCRHNMLPGRVYLKDYNYMKPSQTMEGFADVDENGRGENYIYGVNFDSVKEGNRLAQIRADALLCRKSVFTGESAVPFMVPGYTFDLNRHYKNSYNRKYLVTDVMHEGHQTGYLISGLSAAVQPRDEEMFYANTFTAIYSDFQFRPEHVSEKPKISGTINAKIDAAGSGEYAELDKEGRYKVILPFDRSGRFGGKASAWFRMMQPLAGNNQGMHFPLHKGSEVLMTFIDGDPDRPVIAGAIPNPETSSPVTDGNQTISMIKTGRSNSDQSAGAGDARARSSSDPNNYVEFDDNSNLPYIKLHSPGDIKTHASSSSSRIKNHTPGDILTHATSDLSLIKNESPGTIETWAGGKYKRRELGTSEESGHDRYNDDGGSQMSTDDADDKTNDLVNTIYNFAPVNAMGYDEKKELSATKQDPPTGFPESLYEAPVPAVPPSFDTFYNDTLKIKWDTDGKPVKSEYYTLNDLYGSVDSAWKEYWCHWVQRHHGDAKGYQEKDITYENQTSNEELTSPWYFQDLDTDDKGKVGKLSDDLDRPELDNYCLKQWDDWAEKWIQDWKHWAANVSRGHVRASHRDTFNIQEGNIYDFGGYWNYNLGNNYVENHINQAATLNDSYDFDMLDKGGPSWSSFRTIHSSDGSSKNEIEGNWSNGNCWVEKKFGDTYEFIKGNTLSVVQGNSQEIVIGGKTIEEKYTLNKKRTGIVKRRYFSSASGTVEEKKWTNTGKRLEDKEVKTSGDENLTKNIVSNDYSSKTNLSWKYGTNASLSASLGASTTNSVYSGVNSNLEINNGVKSDIEIINLFWLKLVTGLGLGADFDLRIAGVLSNKPGPKLKFEGVGLCSEAKSPLETKLEFLEASFINFVDMKL